MCMCGLLKLTKAVFRHDIHDVMPGDQLFAVIRIPSAKGPCLWLVHFIIADVPFLRIRVLGDPAVVVEYHR